MSIHREIERKYLVRGDAYRELATASSRVVQGYLSRTPRCTVRVRLRDNRGYLTIKGPSTADGLTRLEWEREIPPDEARQLLALCESGIIDKTRYLVPHGPLVIEVDVFHGPHEGLVLAEIELPPDLATPEHAPLDHTTPEHTTHVHAILDLPSWLGPEVTGDPHYYNAYLSTHPHPS